MTIASLITPLDTCVPLHWVTVVVIHVSLHREKLERRMEGSILEPARGILTFPQSGTALLCVKALTP